MVSDNLTTDSDRVANADVNATDASTHYQTEAYLIIEDFDPTTSFVEEVENLVLDV